MATNPIHDTAWAKTGGWEDDEGLEDYLNRASAPTPWARGQNGKGLILPDHSIQVWGTNQLGEPHHDDVGSPYLAKLDVFPSGATAVMSPDADNLSGIDRPTAEQIVEREGPRQGLFLMRNFTSQRHASGQPVRVKPQSDPHAVWTEVPVAEVKSLGAQRAVPQGLAAEGAVKAGSDQVAHEHAILARPVGAWEDMDGPSAAELLAYSPWRMGARGKGLISRTGELLTWQVNEHGEPHHDVVSQEKRFPYVAKVFVRPNGRVYVPGPDELHLFGVSREAAHGHLRREASRQGLHFVSMPVEDVADRTCPTCGDPLQGEHRTFCPRCSWSESDANVDSDPLSNPPDPTVDMHRGIQATTIPSHRWAKWFQAVEDLA